MLLQSSSQDSLLEEEQAKMDDEQFFAALNPTFETEPGEILISDDFTKPRMEHYRSKWEPSQDAVYKVNLTRAQDEG